MIFFLIEQVKHNFISSEKITHQLNIFVYIVHILKINHNFFSHVGTYSKRKNMHNF